MKPDRIYSKDLRDCGMCMNGARTFFKQNELNFKEFLREGVEIKKIKEIDDVMAKRVIEFVESGERNGWK